MIEVIARGTPPRERVLQVACPTCSSVLSFAPRDAQIVTDTRNKDFFRLACPVCGDEVTKAVA